jgi:hypothetical protein
MLLVSISRRPGVLRAFELRACCAMHADAVPLAIAGRRQLQEQQASIAAVMVEFSDFSDEAFNDKISRECDVFLLTDSGLQT